MVDSDTFPAPASGSVHAIRQPRGAELLVHGSRLASATAHDHDGAVRRRFAVYRLDTGFACERIDDEGTRDERCFGTLAADALEVYHFFGTEPLANYLYGLARLPVPGLRGSAP